jgi:hypothetical protein
MKEIQIQDMIDRFFFGRYANWKRTEDGVKIQWLPDGSEDNWIPVKDWKNTPFTMAEGQLMAFAKYVFEIGVGLREELEVLNNTAEPKKDVCPYVPRKHSRGASSLGYVELSSIASHYGIGIKTLKDILTDFSIPWGPFLKDSNIRSTHSLVASKYLNDVHHAVINSI